MISSLGSRPECARRALLRLLAPVSLVLAGTPAGCVDSRIVAVAVDDDDRAADDDASPVDDADGDGYPAAEDCDDGDPALNHDDADGDGHSSCDGDCDDSNPWFHPGAVDLWGDGVDGDCDGVNPSAGGFVTWISLETSGGETGGVASASYELRILDHDWEEICTVTLAFSGEYAHGAQGGYFWEHVDQVVTLSALESMEDGCPPEVVPSYFFLDDPVTEWRWRSAGHPLAFVSCDRIAGDPVLADTFLGEDAWGLGGDGSFGEACSVMGPAATAQYGPGPVEGVWLMTGRPDTLDIWGDFAYLEPTDTTQTDAWMLGGLLMAAADNTAEPTPGLEGTYEVLPGWIWGFGELW